MSSIRHCCSSTGMSCSSRTFLWPTQICRLSRTSCPFPCKFSPVRYFPLRSTSKLWLPSRNSSELLCTQRLRSMECSIPYDQPHRTRIRVWWLIATSHLCRIFGERSGRRIWLHRRSLHRLQMKRLVHRKFDLRTFQLNELTGNERENWNFFKSKAIVNGITFDQTAFIRSFAFLWRWSDYMSNDSTIRFRA